MRLLRLLAGVLLVLAPAAAQVSRPHVVLVMADDQGLGDMGYTGHPRLETPNFDAAAAAGLRFDRFYAAAPVCSPTRASVLTGRHPHRMGVFKWGHSIRPQEATLAEILREAGYATGHFGKWHLGSVRAEAADSPGANGFDEWLSAPNFYDNDAILSHRGEAVRCRGESSAIAVDAALAWIRERLEDDAPILAVVWFGSPHSPHRAAAEDRERYSDLPQPLQEFYGEITGMDRAFGRLRDGLEEMGMREDTILWYCSDNGALERVGSTAGMRGHKGEVWEGGLRVPAFVEWPARIRAPRVTEVRCTTSDILPTILELAGVPAEPAHPLDGVSLAASITDGEPPAPRGIGFWDRAGGGVSVSSAERMQALLEAQREGRPLPLPAQSRDPAALPDPPLPLDAFPGHAAWIEDGWKLHRIEDAASEVRFELYDLQTDPAETTDRLDAEPERARGLRARLEAWLVSVAASCNGLDYERR